MPLPALVRLRVYIICEFASDTFVFATTPLRQPLHSWLTSKHLFNLPEI